MVLIAVHFDQVRFGYTSEVLYESLSWEIHDDRCVGLIGPNGCGKSTLLQLAAGELSADSGLVVSKKGLSVGYLQQTPHLTAGNTLWQEVYGAVQALFDVEDALNGVEKRLADPAVYNNEEKLARALARQEKLLETYARLGGPSYEGRVRSTLTFLGFSEIEMALPVEVLSGGQAKLAGLAKLMLLQPDLLLLDEPDNHLDLEGKAFLERFIRAYPGGVVIVSHDRYLLDVVVDEIAELDNGKVSVYDGNYSEYAFEKQNRLLRQQQLFMVQQREIRRLEQSAKRLMTWAKIYDSGKFAKRGQNILKRLERIDEIEKPDLEPRRMGLELKGWTGSNKVLEIENLDKVFAVGEDGKAQEENIVLAGLNLLIMRGERVGLVGANGSGKSVLFRLILGQEVPDGGEIVIGPSVRIGYYAQQRETLDPQLTLIDTVRRAGSLSEERAVAFLNRFVFSYEQARGPVGNLSGGEASRLQMALLMLSGANFLLLDEPTNHLDILSAEVLEDALESFEGTVLVISHDRYFLDRVVTRIEDLEEGSLNGYAGNFADYQEAKNRPG